MAIFDPKIVAGSPRRNRFDLSFYSRVTTRMGDLVPVLCKKIVPSDEFRVSINAITRFAPLANPIYDRLRIDYDAFFVQNRIIDPQFKEFLTGGIGLYGETSTEGMQNIALRMNFAATNPPQNYLGNASLFDFLGIGISSEDLTAASGLNIVNVNAEPLLGYLKIYEDWYRNERFQSPYYSNVMNTLYESSSRRINLTFSSSTDNSDFIALRKRNFYKDPFTTALSEPLIGGVIPIMSGQAPIVPNPSNNPIDSMVGWEPGGNTVTVDSGAGLYADLSSVVSNTVQQLNQMYALYRFFMKDTYNGNRYVEFIESHFDVRVPDRREIKVDITGVNHFTWVTGASWQGIDLMPHLKALAEDEDTYKDLTEVSKNRVEEEKWFDCDHLVALSLLRDFGALGAAGDRHLAEFVPFFLTSDEDFWRYGVVRTPYRWRVEEDKRKKAKVYNDDELKATLSDEEGVDIMRSLMGDRTLYTNINRPNEGQITYLPKGRIVESNGFISENSIRPIVSSLPPLSVQNMIRRVSDIQEMTLEAIWNNDEKLLFSAFLSDPLMKLNRDKSKELFDKMLVASSYKR